MPAVQTLLVSLSEDAKASPKAAAWIAEGVPAPLAWRIASSGGLVAALDISEVAEAVQRDVAEVADAHVAVAGRLGLVRLRHLIDALPSESHWQTLAKAALGDDLAQLQRGITQAVLQAGTGSVPELLAQWEAQNADALERAQRQLVELADAPAADLAMLSVALRELRNLA